MPSKKPAPGRNSQQLASLSAALATLSNLLLLTTRQDAGADWRGEQGTVPLAVFCPRTPEHLAIAMRVTHELALASLGLIPQYLNAGQMLKREQTYRQTWGKLIKASGYRPL